MNCFRVQVQTGAPSNGSDVGPEAGDSRTSEIRAQGLQIAMTHQRMPGKRAGWPAIGTGHRPVVYSPSLERSITCHENS